METMDAIMQRRSVRKYTSQQITDEDLQAIIQAGLSAPSGLNLQPWYFVALKSDEQKQSLLSIMDGVSISIAPELEERFAKYPALVADTRNFIRFLGNAPVVLLAFLEQPHYADEKTAIISVAAAVENALIEARSLGIASCWLTAPDQTGYGPEIRDRFAPGKGMLVATVTLGYTDQWPNPVPRRNGRFTIL